MHEMGMMLLTCLNWQEKVEIISKQVQNHLTLTGTAVNKRWTTTSAGEEMEEIETLIHRWGECKMVQTLGKAVWQFLKKLNINTITLLLDVYPGEIETSQDHYSGGLQMETTQMSISDEQQTECSSVSTMEYYAAIKSNEMQVQPTTWMGLQ